MSTKQNPSEPINVCIVEDHIDYRTILSDAMASTDRLRCQEAFSNVEDILDHLKEGSNAPDIIILDLGLPGMDGIDAIPLLREAAPQTQVLVLTVFDNKTRVFQALGAGASGYLIKSDDLDVTIQGIEDAYNGIAPLSAEIAHMVFATFSKFKPSSPDEQLSSREIAVLSQLETGASRQEAADALGISIHTISTHIKTIYRKLQVHNVSGAVSEAIAKGLI
ncbi:DNA-binding response regulator [Oceaniferula spumae]|uniref:DNA-binding response regulator n=1 Tax=Oceaniferula spumae TaxID=2979115 RepID=A0AAT9FIW8_9BACT